MASSGISVLGTTRRGCEEQGSQGSLQRLSAREGMSHAALSTAHLHHSATSGGLSRSSTLLATFSTARGSTESLVSTGDRMIANDTTWPGNAFGPTLGLVLNPLTRVRSATLCTDIPRNPSVSGLDGLASHTASLHTGLLPLGTFGRIPEDAVALEMSGHGWVTRARAASADGQARPGPLLEPAQPEYMLGGKGAPLTPSVSSVSLSRMAEELDLPVNGARYSNCVICRVPGICSDDRCCKMPRHQACEMANQRCNADKWKLSPRGTLLLPCSACRQIWSEISLGHPLAVEVAQGIVREVAAERAAARATMLAESGRGPNADPVAVRKAWKRFLIRAIIFGPAALLVGVLFIQGLDVGVTVAAVLGAAVVSVLLAHVLIEHIRGVIITRAAASIAREEDLGLAVDERPRPAWVEAVMAAAKAGPA
jgi:hypothetical protein